MIAFINSAATDSVTTELSNTSGYLHIEGIDAIAKTPLRIEPQRGVVFSEIQIHSKIFPLMHTTGKEIAL